MANRNFRVNRNRRATLRHDLFDSKFLCLIRDNYVIINIALAPILPLSYVLRFYSEKQITDYWGLSEKVIQISTQDTLPSLCTMLLWALSWIMMELFLYVEVSEEVSTGRKIMRFLVGNYILALLVSFLIVAYFFAEVKSSNDLSDVRQIALLFAVLAGTFSMLIVPMLSTCDPILFELSKDYKGKSKGIKCLNIIAVIGFTLYLCLYFEKEHNIFWELIFIFGMYFFLNIIVNIDQQGEWGIGQLVDYIKKFLSFVVNFQKRNIALVAILIIVDSFFSRIWGADYTLVAMVSIYFLLLVIRSGIRRCGEKGDKKEQPIKDILKDNVTNIFVTLVLLMIVSGHYLVKLIVLYTFLLFLFNSFLFVFAMGIKDFFSGSPKNRMFMLPVVLLAVFFSVGIHLLETKNDVNLTKEFAVIMNLQKEQLIRLGSKNDLAVVVYETSERYYVMPFHEEGIDVSKEESSKVKDSKIVIDTSRSLSVAKEGLIVEKRVYTEHSKS